MIRQTLADGREVVRFVPLPADETPAAMDELCRHLAAAWDSQQADRLLVINAFILDFLCIHPFRDGNGRLARLLTLLLLYAAGYEVGRYISLERVVENQRDVLRGAAAIRRALGSRPSRFDPLASIQPERARSRLPRVRAASSQHGDRAKRQEPSRAGGSQHLESGRDYRRGRLERLCPTASRATIRRVLDERRKQGQVECLGKGQLARWQKVGM